MTNCQFYTQRDMAYFLTLAYKKTTFFICRDIEPDYENNSQQFDLLGRALITHDSAARGVDWMHRWESKMLENLPNQYIFMSLITGSSKLIPFHYCGHCQTETGTERCQSMNQQQLYRCYMPILSLGLAGLCCCKALNCLELADWGVFLFTVCCLRGETACSGC